MEPGNNLRAHELEPEAWKALVQLQDILKIQNLRTPPTATCCFPHHSFHPQVFKSVTLSFSRAKVPNLARVIPVMDHVEETLTGVMHGTKYDNAICVACRLAKKVLNNYYSLTDALATYRIAMVMHPRYKLEYFEKLKWTCEWQDTARELVEAEYANCYTGRFNPSESGSGSGSGNSRKSSPAPRTPQTVATNDEDSSSSSSESDHRDLFDLLDNWDGVNPDSGISDKLEHYLATPIDTTGDVIRWWKDRRSIYPNLSHMAIDYLVIPGSWSMLGLIKGEDARKVAEMDDIEGDDDIELEQG
uniref:HAT C-terminal dimerisation domain-containing protein n=1 Tax=Ganoderma boninense TaxID=34458 RepID=A0A5K1JYU5_9APHY|nr:Uncharacterized protein [Ganoderma boninense]